MEIGFFKFWNLFKKSLTLMGGDGDGAGSSDTGSDDGWGGFDDGGLGGYGSVNGMAGGNEGVGTLGDAGNGITGDSYGDSDWGGYDTYTDTVDFEGGTVTYSPNNASYSVEYADGRTQGYDEFTGISYETNKGGSYGVTATLDDGTSVTFDTMHDLQAQIEQDRIDKAKKTGMSVGSILGPAGMLLGYFIGGKAYKALNPDKVGEVLGRQAFSDNVETATSTGTNSITLSSAEASDWLNGNGTLNIASSGIGGTISYTLNKPTESSTTSYSAIDSSPSGWIDYMKERQAEWDKVFGPVQDNLANYYKNLTPDSYEAQQVAAIHTEYQKAMEGLQKTMAQRGITDSGINAAAMGRLEMAKAQDIATARIQAPEAVAQQQMNFLQTGLRLEPAIQSNIGSAYSSTLASDTQKALGSASIEAQQSIQDAQEQSALYGALGTAAGLFW